MFDFSEVSKRDIDLVNNWHREYRNNCKQAKVETDQKIFEYICNDCERLVKLMRSRGVTAWQVI